MGRVTKAEQDNAFNEGRAARDSGCAIDDCPHEGLALQDAWKRGFTESKPSAESADGHKFNDPSVVEFGANLAELMQAFDNAGVSIVEEQFRAFQPEEINIATKWANDVRTGNKRPVPECLRKYATKELIAFSDGYYEGQEAGRKVLMKCRYGKPSPTMPEGDDGEKKIKMTVLVPIDEVQPGTAESIWGGKRCTVEFALKNVNQWQKELPGTETVISCETEIKGYSRKMHDWQFSFLVSQTLLEVETAFDDFWKSAGSCRVTPIGNIDKASESEESDSDDDETEDAKQPKLFGGDDEDDDVFIRKMDDGKFVSPDEYLIPLPTAGEGHSVIISIGQGPNDRFYASSIMEFVDDKGFEDEDDWGNPQYKGDGCVAVKDAVEKELGSLIDFVEKQRELPKVLTDLRTELKRLSDGGEPCPMPDE